MSSKGSLSSPIKNRLSELRVDIPNIDHVDPIPNVHIIDAKDEEKYYLNIPSTNNITSDIAQLQKSTHQIELLSDAQLTCIDENIRKQSIEHVNRIVTLAQKNNVLIKNNIVALKSMIDKETSDFKRRAFLNVYNVHTVNFQNAIIKFHDAVEKFHILLRRKSEYHLKTVRPDLSNEEIQDIIKNGLTEKVIEQSFISQHLEKTIVDIEVRHTEILHLEQQIQEIYELTRDFSLLVDLQQEKLDIIDVRVKNSVQTVNDGAKNLVVADKYSKKTLRRACIICCIFIIILCVIIFPVLTRIKLV